MCLSVLAEDMRQVDQVVMHFARDGLILLKDIPEAQDQMEAAAFRKDKIQVFHVIGKRDVTNRASCHLSKFAASGRTPQERMLEGCAIPKAQLQSVRNHALET